MRKVILVSTIVGGTVAALTGLGVGGVLLLSLAMVGGAAGTPLIISTLALGVTVVLGGLGLLLAWSGWRSLKGGAGAPLRLAGWGWWLLAFALTVAIGYVVFEAGFAAPVAVLLVAANAAAVGWAVALAAGSARRSWLSGSGIEASAGLSGRRTQPADPKGGWRTASTPEMHSGVIPARPVAGSLAWGGVGGVGLALIVEVMALLAAILLASVWLTAARPDLLAQLQAWAEGVQADRPGELTELLPLLDSPWVVIAVLTFASGLVPVLEEIAKALAVPLVALTGRRVRRVDGFLLGAAAGAGFALLEGVLNGALGLTASGAWVGALLARGAATTMHCAASALAGLGWVLIMERRWWAGLGAGGAAVALHGAWNAAAIGLAARALVGGGNAVGALFVGYLGILWLLAVLLLALLPRWLAEHDA